jgi:hypothetical protein
MVFMWTFLLKEQEKAFIKEKLHRTSHANRD